MAPCAADLLPGMLDLLILRVLQLNLETREWDRMQTALSRVMTLA